MREQVKETEIAERKRDRNKAHARQKERETGGDRERQLERGG